MDTHNRFRSSKSACPTQPVRRLTTRQAAESQLRDIACVLHLTRRVWEEILSDRKCYAISQVCRA